MQEFWYVIVHRRGAENAEENICFHLLGENLSAKAEICCRGNVFKVGVLAIRPCMVVFGECRHIHHGAEP